jgi:glyoxylase-like metal-dependent hydrolase (beta-lactamase superfamily II)
MVKSHPANAPGNWYIDTRCTDCSAARTVAPGLIVARDGQSVFARQPETPEEIRIAWRARLLCPTASVRTMNPATIPDGVFPEAMTANVYRLGYNANSSYGAHSFLIRREGGNAMVDAPRFARAVVKQIEEWGGLAEILLTHRDDVADAQTYAKHFGARVSIHKWDRASARFASNILEGAEPIALAHDLIAIPVPGHTKGSVAYLYEERCLFSGDSLAWSFEKDDLTAWRDFCWYSWAEQTKSLARLLEFSFAWVLAGHGGSKGLAPDDMCTRLAALVERMKTEA